MRLLGLTILIVVHTSALFGAHVLVATIVESSTGSAVNRAAIRVHQSSKNGMATVVAMTESDVAGRFQCSTPTAGEYSIELRKTGYLPTFITMTIDESSPHPSRHRVFAMVRTGSIEGRIVDTDSFPIAGAGVFSLLRQGQENRWILSAGSARTDHEGRFRLSGLSPGRYRVGAYDLSGPGGLIRGAHLLPNNSRPSEFVILDGEAHIENILQLPRTELVNIAGRVTMEGTDVAASVSLVPQIAGHMPAQTFLSNTGHFSFDRLIPGGYELLARSLPTQGRSQLFGKLSLIVTTDMKALNLPVGPGMHVVMVLRPPSNNGAYCSEAAGIALVPIGVQYPQVTATVGTLAPTTLGPLAPVPYAMTVSHPKAGCYGPGMLVFDGGSLPQRVELSVDLPGAVRGQVVDTGEVPSAGVVVRLLPFGPGHQRPVRDYHLSQSADFSFERVVPGLYYIMARSDQSGRDWRPIAGVDPDVLDVATSDVVLRLHLPPKMSANH